MVRAAPAAASLVLTLSVSGLAQAPPSLELVMERVTSYLHGYGAEYAATVADERYFQKAGSRSALLESEFGIVKLPGITAWLGFRDVIRKDGRPVADREARLASLYAQASSASGVTRSTTTEAMRVVRESARFNIGPVERTINNPAVVLELLDPSHHRGFRFSKAGEEDVAGVPAWRIRFTERQSPTVIQTPNGRNLPAFGEFWADPSTGRLLRADVTLRVPNMVGMAREFQARVSVTFREDPNLNLWVPDRMLEQYQYASTRIFFQEGEATYTNYRRFRVESKMISFGAP
jgi:hypothetical protein